MIDHMPGRSRDDLIRRGRAISYSDARRGRGRDFISYYKFKKLICLSQLKIFFFLQNSMMGLIAF